MDRWSGWTGSTSDDPLLRCRFCRRTARRNSRSLARENNFAPATAPTCCRCGMTPFTVAAPQSSVTLRAQPRALTRLERDGPVDCTRRRLKLRYVNPATGGSPMPTMATFLQLLPQVSAANQVARQTVFRVQWLRGRAAPLSGVATGLMNRPARGAVSWRRCHCRPATMRFVQLFRPTRYAGAVLWRENALPDHAIFLLISNSRSQQTTSPSAALRYLCPSSGSDQRFPVRRVYCVGRNCDRACAR